MKPERIAPDVLLYPGGDAFKIMPEMADESVDHVFADPPYGEQTHKGARTGGDGEKVLIDFDSITDEQFVTFCREAVRVSRRWVLLTCEWRHAVAVEREMPEAFVRLGVWYKPDGSPQFTGDRPGTGWEGILILHRPGRKKWNGGGHHAFWSHPVERNNVHRTQKPLKLLRRWVKQFTDEGDTILDAFAGSGTTGVAALIEGRGAVLIERKPEYCDIIRDRIRTADGTKPGTLLALLPQQGSFDCDETTPEPEEIPCPNL